MAKIIKKKGKYFGVSERYNTAGNELMKGQKPMVISQNKKRILVLKILRKKGYSI